MGDDAGAFQNATNAGSVERPPESAPRSGAPRSSIPRSGVSVKASGAAALDPTRAGSALTLIHPVLPERRAALVELLTRMGTSIATTTELLFDELESVHFMRWVVIDGATPGEPAALAFESNHDGTLEEHLAELYAHGARAMHAIYRCCAGYPCAGSPELGDDQLAAAQSFLLAGKVEPAAFYVGRRGKTVRQIRREARLRDCIQRFLDGLGSDPMRHFQADPEVAYDAILAHLSQTQRADLDALSEPGPAAPRRSLGAIALRALPLVPLVPLLPGLYALLRYKELTDVPDDADHAPAEQARRLAEREDFQVQNQLTHLVARKPGLFRLLTTRLVLYAITTLARFHFNQGHLGGLSTIHYARWVLIDGGRRLLFFSNYDGSWERYLGDFIDQAHVGLTAVWSNTQGFPRTSHLVCQGATDEERFKAWTRAHQLPTQLWYSAYPSLTVPNIGRNSCICAGLANKPATREALERWLELL